MILPSSLVFSLGMEADWPLTARLDERRLSSHTMDLVRAFGEQGRPTALASSTLVCAFREQRRSTSPYGPLFWMEHFRDEAI